MSDALLGAAEIRQLAAELNLRPTKSLGQNFVLDANTVRRIVRAARVADSDVVLEIGPGLGSLTLGLLSVAASVIAVEVDPRLASRLPRTVAERSPSRADRLTVLTADALHVRAADLPANPAVLVANLPYNVAVPVLLHLVFELPALQRVLVMVQAEVAERLTAGVGSRIYGAPTVKLAWWGTARPAGAVSRSVFWPVPNVDSSLVAVTRRAEPIDPAHRPLCFRIVDAAFSQRRKMLRSALAGIFGSPAEAADLLAASGIDPASRAEQLSVDDFARLTAVVAAAVPA